MPAPQAIFRTIYLWGVPEIFGRNYAPRIFFLYFRAKRSEEKGTRMTASKKSTTPKAHAPGLKSLPAPGDVPAAHFDAVDAAATAENRSIAGQLRQIIQEWANAQKSAK